MYSNELRSILGELKFNLEAGIINMEQVNQRLSTIDFSSIIDNDGNLENLKKLVFEWFQYNI